MKRRLFTIAILFAPTVIVAGIWIASGFAPKSLRGLPAPLSWNWRIEPHYVRIERTLAAVSITSLPAGTVSSMGSPPFYGYTFKGGSVDPFGWIDHSSGYYFTGIQATPAHIFNISLVIS